MLSIQYSVPSLALQEKALGSTSELLHTEYSVVVVPHILPSAQPQIYRFAPVMLGQQGLDLLLPPCSPDWSAGFRPSTPLAPDTE